MYDGVKKKPLASYNSDLYNVMQHAHMIDRPVKITNFHEKIDEFNEKPLLTLGNQLKVEYSTKMIPFETVKGIVEKMNHITSLEEKFQFLKTKVWFSREPKE